MKLGPTPELPSEKRARGTFQPVRDANRVAVIEPNAMPMRPTWLTAEGEEVWLDDVGRVQPGKLVRRTPELRDAFGLTACAKSITCDLNGGCVQTINAKGSTPDGHNPHLSVLDELHAPSAATPMPRRTSAQR